VPELPTHWCLLNKVSRKAAVGLELTQLGVEHRPNNLEQHGATAADNVCSSSSYEIAP
jgi:hypothetical protein